jgi:hypothetical protein
MTTLDDVYEMISQGWGTPDGRGRIAIAEEAIRHAEALGNPDAEFAARMLGTTAYHQGGEPAKAFVTFARCLAQYDADPGARDHDDEHLLLWHFKFITGALPRFPEIPLQRTYEVLDDMERRYRAGGHSLHAVYAYRQRVARHLGDEALADHYYRLWDTAPRDSNSDCVGCDPTSKVYFLTSRGRFEDAVALAEPVLAGRMTCAEQPQEILTSLLEPYLRTGQLDRARDAHRRSYRALASSLSWLDRAPTPIAEMEFAAAAAAVLSRLDDIECRTPGGPRMTRELGEELAKRARAIGARFDARNGNSHQGDLVERTLALEPIVDYLPLSITARAGHAAGNRLPQAEAEPEPPVDLSDVPGDVPLDEQLALASRWRLEGEEARAFALWARIEEQVPAETMTLGQLARMEQYRAYRTDDVGQATVDHFDRAT